MVRHFFGSLADALGAAIHVEVRGENTHHMVEACFKAVGRCLRDAVRREGTAMPSTKGMYNSELVWRCQRLAIVESLCLNIFLLKSGRNSFK